MEYITVPDTAIIAMHCGKQNKEASIVYRDPRGSLHTIDFEVCAINFAGEHGLSSGRCIGERKSDEYFFLFYTSGRKTKIVFERLHVGIFHRPFFLTGAKASRFLALWNQINQTEYTTYDLS